MHCKTAAPMFAVISSSILTSAWELPAKPYTRLLSFLCNPMLNVCLVRDLILLWDLMSGYLQSEPHAAIAGFGYHVLLTYRSRLCFLSPCYILGCKRILVFCDIYWYEATAAGIHFGILIYSVCFSEAGFVGDEQITSNKFEPLVRAVLLSSWSGKQEQVNAVRQLSQTSQ